MKGSQLVVWSFVGGLAFVASVWAEDTRGFAVGVEYMVPGLAEVYAKTGVTWAKAMGKGFAWDDIEPEPPVGGRHRYRWEYPDRLILEYQQAGFRHIQVYVKSLNRWASIRPVKAVGGGSSLPKPEYMEDYKAYLRALVHRYDPNHPDHVPGLRYPVEYWEIEAEWGTGFWQGTLEEYVQLLRVAYPTIKQANPRAQVILIGFFLAGVFEGRPDPAEIPSALRAMPAQRRRISEQYLEDMRQLLAHPDLFDVVEFHSLSDWSEISGMARFIQGVMRQHGYLKPIWVGDVNYTAHPLMFWGIPVPPYTEQQKPAILATLRALANPQHAQHAEAKRWLRCEQSRGLVKKAVLAMAEGLAGINLGNLKDEGLFGVLPQITGTVAFQGLIETKGSPPQPGRPRPAYHALALVVQKLGRYARVERLDIGAGIFAYRFTVDRRPVYVIWYDDGRRYLPGDPEAVVHIRLPLPAGQYQLSETPTDDVPRPARSVTIPPSGWDTQVGPTPIFLEPVMQ